ncbi:purine-nucleoside phosphorylase [Parolsenella sp.]|uniref:purine-nucleoside phosphorylase n=1 Tax=Parolsenella sp. TaxID=2083006 RepID=UPI0039BF9458|nr:purine-nucleoside phosphorylase [Coriobacteriaceae bacterium]
MDLIVSRCLLGERCRYDGGARPCASVEALVRSVRDGGGRVVPICPEVDGGLTTPRPPAEILGDSVITVSGDDVTAAYVRGARFAAFRARELSSPLAVLKAKSPACGSGVVYDGTHTGRLVRGTGFAACALEKEGIIVVDEKVVEGCRASVEHPVAIVLGSGLGALAAAVKPVRRIPYADIDGFPVTARPVAGHTFEATVGTIDGVPVVVYPGRVHLYQGYDPAQVTSLVRHAYKLGCRDIIFACATGAIAGRAHVGLGLITDHLNLTGTNPLIEDEDLACVESPFVGMTDVYTPYLRSLAAGVAADNGIDLQQGVYAGLLGPCFETGAEVAMLGSLGASYAGMSLVCEAIMAHALGMNVLGVTLAANMAGEAGVTHESVLKVAHDHENDFETLIRGVLARLK